MEITRLLCNEPSVRGETSTLVLHSLRRCCSCIIARSVMVCRWTIVVMQTSSLFLLSLWLLCSCCDADVFSCSDSSHTSTHAYKVVDAGAGHQNTRIQRAVNTSTRVIDGSLQRNLAIFQGLRSWMALRRLLTCCNMEYHTCIPILLHVLHWDSFGWLWQC